MKITEYPNIDAANVTDDTSFIVNDVNDGDLVNPEGDTKKASIRTIIAGAIDNIFKALKSSDIVNNIIQKNYKVLAVDPATGEIIKIEPHNLIQDMIIDNVDEGNTIFEINPLVRYTISNDSSLVCYVGMDDFINKMFKTPVPLPPPMNNIGMSDIYFKQMVFPCFNSVDGNWYVANYNSTFMPCYNFYLLSTYVRFDFYGYVIQLANGANHIFHYVDLTLRESINDTKKKELAKFAISATSIDQMFAQTDVSKKFGNAVKPPFSGVTMTYYEYLVNYSASGPYFMRLVFNGQELRFDMSGWPFDLYGNWPVNFKYRRIPINM